MYLLFRECECANSVILSNLHKQSILVWLLSLITSDSSKCKSEYYCSWLSFQLAILQQNAAFKLSLSRSKYMLTANLYIQVISVSLNRHIASVIPPNITSMQVNFKIIILLNFITDIENKSSQAEINKNLLLLLLLFFLYITALTQYRKWISVCRHWIVFEYANTLIKFNETNSQLFAYVLIYVSHSHQ